MLRLLEVACVVSVQASNVAQGSRNGSVLSYLLLKNPDIFVACGSKD